MAGGANSMSDGPHDDEGDDGEDLTEGWVGQVWIFEGL